MQIVQISDIHLSYVHDPANRFAAPWTWPMMSAPTWPWSPENLITGVHDSMWDCVEESAPIAAPPLGVYGCKRQTTKFYARAEGPGRAPLPAGPA